MSLMVVRLTSPRQSASSNRKNTIDTKAAAGYQGKPVFSQILVGLLFKLKGCHNNPKTTASFSFYPRLMPNVLTS